MPKKVQTSKQELFNAAKTLFANIQFSSVDHPIKTMMMTSSVPNEGKTTVSITLGRAIATSGKTVLLVETDMRRRSMANELAVHPRYGLYALLSDQVGLKQAMVPTDQPNLYFLDAEPHIPNPPDVLSSKRFSKLIDRLSQTYDYVICDTPPVGTFVDAAIVSTLVDATMLVIRENFAKRDEVLRAKDQLEKAGANLVGIVMNDCEIERNSYYYAYYTKDNKRIKKKEKSPTSNVGIPLPKVNRGSKPVKSEPSHNQKS